MKKIILCLFVITVAATSFCQSQTIQQGLTYEEYMKKSRRQNKTGWILLGGGIAVAAITTLIASQIDSGGEATGIIVLGIISTGFMTMPVSIPFFFSAHRNKKKAMNLSVKNESAFRLSNNYFLPRYLPSVSLKINL